MAGLCRMFGCPSYRGDYAEISTKDLIFYLDERYELKVVRCDL